MQIIDLEIESNQGQAVGVALGNFDGFHLGHRSLIEDMVKLSKKNGLKSSLLLFENHTKEIIRNKKPGMLTSNQQKYRLAEKMGVDIIFTLKFTEDIMQLSQEDFIKRILVDRLKCSLAVVGFDYRFGYKAQGNSESLKKIGEGLGIRTKIVKPVVIDGKVISSTLIRELIREGKVEDAARLLGRDYSIVGQVVKGAQRGSKLGFPTANLSVDEDYVLPDHGVYYSDTMVDGLIYRSTTDIGLNPTFEGDRLKIESYILDFNRSIYGQEIEVYFKKYLRDDVKFNSKEELIRQIHKDVELVRSFE